MIANFKSSFSKFIAKDSTNGFSTPKAKYITNMDIKALAQ
jgi:hypothetical protein